MLVVETGIRRLIASSWLILLILLGLSTLVSQWGFGSLLHWEIESIFRTLHALEFILLDYDVFMGAKFMVISTPYLI